MSTFIAPSSWFISAFQFSIFFRSFRIFKLPQRSSIIGHTLRTRPWISPSEAMLDDWLSKSVESLATSDFVRKKRRLFSKFNLVVSLNMRGIENHDKQTYLTTKDVFSRFSQTSLPKTQPNHEIAEIRREDTIFVLSVVRELISSSNCCNYCQKTAAGWMETFWPRCALFDEEICRYISLSGAADATKAASCSERSRTSFSNWKLVKKNFIERIRTCIWLFITADSASSDNLFFSVISLCLWEEESGSQKREERFELKHSLRFLLNQLWRFFDSQSKCCYLTIHLTNLRNQHENEGQRNTFIYSASFAAASSSRERLFCQFLSKFASSSFKVSSIPSLSSWETTESKNRQKYRSALIVVMLAWSSSAETDGASWKSAEATLISLSHSVIMDNRFESSVEVGTRDWSLKRCEGKEMEVMVVRG